MVILAIGRKFLRFILTSKRVQIGNFVLKGIAGFCFSYGIYLIWYGSFYFASANVGEVRWKTKFAVCGKNRSRSVEYGERGMWKIFDFNFIFWHKNTCYLFVSLRSWFTPFLSRQPVGKVAKLWEKWLQKTSFSEINEQMQIEKDVWEAVIEGLDGD